MKHFYLVLSLLFLAGAGYTQTLTLRADDSITPLDERLSIGKTLSIPYGPIPTLNGGLAKEGSLFFNTVDSLLYIYKRAAGWKAVANAENLSDYLLKSDTTSLSSRINLKANDVDLIHKTSNETATGNKTFQRITTDSLMFKGIIETATKYLNFGRTNFNIPTAGRTYRWSQGYAGISTMYLTLEAQANTDGADKAYRSTLSILGRSANSAGILNMSGNVNASWINTTLSGIQGGNINGRVLQTSTTVGSLSRPYLTSNHGFFTDSTTTNLVIGGGNGLGKELLLDKTQLTDHRTLTFPNKSGTIALMSDIIGDSNFMALSGNQTATGIKSFESIAIPGKSGSGNDFLIMEGNNGDILFTDIAGAGNHNVKFEMPISAPSIAVSNRGISSYINSSGLTADRFLNLPDKSGTIALLSDIPTVVNGNYLPLSGGMLTGSATISNYGGLTVVNPNTSTEKAEHLPAYSKWSYTGGKYVSIDGSAPSISFNNGSSRASIKANNITGPREIELPNKSGTIALLSDIAGEGSGEYAKLTQDNSFTGTQIINKTGSSRALIVNSTSGNQIQIQYSGDIARSADFSINSNGDLDINTAGNRHIALNRSGTGNVYVGREIGYERFNVDGYVLATGYKIPSGTSSQFLNASGTVSALKTINGNSLIGSGDLNVMPNFGSDAGTIAEGNDSRIANGQTAFNWGNHAEAGYITGSGVVHKAGAETIGGVKTFSDQTILNGALTGASASFSGNVGIGTTNPDMTLTVKGKIHAEEVKVDLNVPGPDYVFEKDYNLKSLQEVEEYILENKHLPEVPSAKKMEKEGISMGDMQMKLLQKVEELTLYIIEQNKRADQQDKVIAKQQEEIDSLKKKLK